jgi:tRNA-Thr(GGU) m(6)t(6)A37 methyltransferase TsaA
MELWPIGIVRSPAVAQTDKGWGGVVSEIHLEERYQDGLQGIEAFSHAVVIFFMDQAAFDIGADLIRRPQGRADMPKTGIFAQRAKHRPNPIGITAVRVECVRGHVLLVRGLDAIDGTPVLDIKPYFPCFDRIADACVPEWVQRLMAAGYF